MKSKYIKVLPAVALLLGSSAAFATADNVVVGEGSPHVVKQVEDVTLGTGFANFQNVHTGDSLVYRIVVSGDVKGLRLSDVLPAGVSGVDYNKPAFDGPVDIDVTVTATSGQVVNTAKLSRGDYLVAKDSATVCVTPAPTPVPTPVVTPMPTPTPVVTPAPTTTVITNNTTNNTTTPATTTTPVVTASTLPDVGGSAQ
jgi:hypothetical protein